MPPPVRDQLSQMNPGFILPGADSGHDWVPVTSLLAGTPDSGQRVDQALGLVAERLRTAETWIAASIMFEGWAARLTSLYAGWHHLYDGHLDPVARSIRQRVRIGRRFLDSAIAAALAGSLTTLARAGHGPLDALLTQPWARPSQVRPHGRWMAGPGGPRYARDTCCGYQRVPDGGCCQSCPLRSPGRIRQSR